MLAIYRKWTPPQQTSSNASRNICQETLQIQADQIRSDTLLCECSQTPYNHLVYSRWNEITLKMYLKTILSPKETFKNFTFKKIKNLPRRDIKTVTIFCLSKSPQNMCSKVTSVFHLNCTKKIH